MIIVVLILALVVLWAIVLGPPLLEKRKGSPANSIVAFNQRLSILASTQRAAPPNGAISQAQGARPTPPGTRPQNAGIAYPPPGSTVTLVTQDGRPVPKPEPQRFPPPSPAPIPPHELGLQGPPATASPAIPVHEMAQVKRRRQIFQVLLAAAGGTFVLGLLPGARAILFLSFVFIGLLGAYVYLLLKWKQNRFEQDRKVRHLRATEMQAPAGEIIDKPDEGLRLVAGDSPE